MELLRGDTPIVPNTETDKEKETEKNSMETVPDTPKRFALIFKNFK